MATLIEKLDQLLEASDDRWPDLPDAVADWLGHQFGDDDVALTVAGLKALPDLLELAKAVAPSVGCYAMVKLGYGEHGVMQYKRCGECVLCRFHAALKPLFEAEPEGFASELFGLEVGR